MQQHSIAEENLKTAGLTWTCFAFYFFHKLLRRNRSEKTRDRGKNADAGEAPGTHQGGCCWSRAKSNKDKDELSTEVGGDWSALLAQERLKLALIKNKNNGKAKPFKGAWFHCCQEKAVVYVRLSPQKVILSFYRSRTVNVLFISQKLINMTFLAYSYYRN